MKKEMKEAFLVGIDQDQRLVLSETQVVPFFRVCFVIGFFPPEDRQLPAAPLVFFSFLLCPGFTWFHTNGNKRKQNHRRHSKAQRSAW